MSGTRTRRRLEQATTPRGEAVRELRLGRLALRLEGLDAGLARELEGRWGGFLVPQSGAVPDLVLQVTDAGAEDFLPESGPGEGYRLESRDGLIVSYHFAIARQAAGWKIAVTRQQREPLGRVVENAVRYLTARLALRHGGFALHAAGLLHEGKAYLLAGPSGSGKTTAVGLSAPAQSLGDDFAVVLAGRSGWSVPALPFDNSEQVEDRPSSGEYPLVRILKLFKAAKTRIEGPPAGLASASLLGCAAFPWALPDQADPLLDRVRAVVSSDLYRHLHFARETPFWAELISDDSSVRD